MSRKCLDGADHSHGSVNYWYWHSLVPPLFHYALDEDALRSECVDVCVCKFVVALNNKSSLVKFAALVCRCVDICACGVYIVSEDAVGRVEGRGAVFGSEDDRLLVCSDRENSAALEFSLARCNSDALDIERVGSVND